MWVQFQDSFTGKQILEMCCQKRENAFGAQKAYCTLGLLSEKLKFKSTAHDNNYLNRNRYQLVSHAF